MVVFFWNFEDEEHRPEEVAKRSTLFVDSKQLTKRRADEYSEQSKECERCLPLGAAVCNVQGGCEFVRFEKNDRDEFTNAKSQCRQCSW